MTRKILETCLSPALFEAGRHNEFCVVIIDVLRASSAICTAFENGVSAIVPVSEVQEAKEYKNNGYLVAAERDGFVLDFADFGNSPFNFTKEKVSGKTIAYSTTNGTAIINMAKSARQIMIGSFLNMSALCKYLINNDQNVLLMCAGWKNRVNLEDTLCAGAISDILIKSNHFSTICDSTHAAIDLWSMAKDDLFSYLEKAAQRSRLREKNLDDCIEFCFTPDFTDKVPVLKNGILMVDTF